MQEFAKPSGTFLKTSSGHKSFIPAFLPPMFDFTELIPLISEASNLIGMLNGLGKNLKNPHLLIKPQLMKEAVQSSKIEGSQVSLSDLYHQQIGTEEKVNQVIDSEEVTNYVDALEMALNRVSDGTDIDLNLINECHKMLLRGVRGTDSIIGSLRTKQNWIGPDNSKIEAARYIPPIPERVPDLIENLIDFTEGPPRRFIPLLQCAIVHYQFEAIHPYEDGNGRIGRLMIPLMLANRHLLSVPLLYLSGYIEQHKEKYYELLLNVSCKSEWIEWVRFFLLAVIHQSKVAIQLIEDLDKLRVEYIKKTNIKKISGSVIKIIDILFESPIITRGLVEDRLNVTHVTAKNAIDKLVKLEILKDLGIYKTRKVYGAEEIYQLLNK